MKKYLSILIALFVFLIVIQPNSFSQDSSRLRISLITCSPGEELYSIFGHSAIRIIDSNSVTDYVFNFGTFNFDDNFYLNFTKGKLNYYLSVSTIEDFMYEYFVTNRKVFEQELMLSGAEKKNIQHILNENSKEENKYYQYDFFYNNCTTRLRDLLLQFKHPTPSFPIVMKDNTTFRKALHTYLERGNQYWSELGIDLLLGSPVDKVMSASEQAFLPENLMNALNAYQHSQLIKNTTILNNPNTTIKNQSANEPLVVFSFLLIAIVPLSYIKNNKVNYFLSIFDRMLFSVTGLLGLLLIGMWLFTDHQTMKNNYNILWACPFNLIAPFIISSNKNLAKSYFLLTSIFFAVVICCWNFLPQQYNISLFPFVLLLLFRSIRIYRK